MRQNATRLNRTWLSVLGLLLLLIGIAVIIASVGLLSQLAKSTGVAHAGPAAADPLLGSPDASTFSASWVAVAVAVAGVVLALLGLAWLAAQIPRANQAKPFRLYDDPEHGLTRCSPSALTNAVETQIKGFPDVQNVSAVLRGTATHPDLTVKVTANERADLPRLLDTIATQVAGDVGQALDTQLRRLGVQVEIGSIKAKTHQITLDPRRSPVPREAR